jgi:group I intron endonuclease
MEYQYLKMYGCGIYIIYSKKNRKLYIGGTVDLRKRKNHHLGRLRKNKHVNQSLQSDFNRFGESSFTFFCIEYCDISSVEKREQFYLDKHKKDAYNAINKARLVFGENHPRFGKTLSEESRKKIREARAKQIISHSLETRAKIGRKGRYVDPEHIKKMVAARNGKCWNKGVTKEDNPNLASKYKILFSAKESKRILKIYEKGISIEEIRKEYKISWDAVRGFLRDNGVITRNISQQRKIK